MRDLMVHVKNLKDDVLDVYVQDQITNPLEWYVSRKITTTNLTNNIVVTDEGLYFQTTPTVIVTLDDVTGAVADPVGNFYLEIWEGFFQYQGEIVNVAGNNITLANPIEFPFTTEATVYIVDINQNRDFTDATGIGEQEYSFAPAPNFLGDWHINRFMITMLHPEESDSSTYGDIQGGLDLGISYCGLGTLFPSETGLPRDLRLGYCLFNIKKNSDYKSVAFDVSYDPKSGNPASPTLYGTSVRKTFNGQDKSGVAIPIRRERNETSSAILRDDLSDLSLHRIRAIGHLVV
jgi:hypothetical protein